MVRSITQDYTAVLEDYYIGVNSEISITITLPTSLDGKQYIIKAEMKPPMSKRKVIIISEDNCKFDGYTNHVLHISHESVWLIKNGKEWHVITK